MSEFFDRKAVAGWVMDLLPCLRCGAMVHANLFTQHEAFHVALDDATASDAAMSIHDDDDEDPAAIRAAFDRGPHGVTGSSGGARIVCGNVEYVTVGGFVESHKDCRAALDAAQDEIEKLIGEKEALRAALELRAPRVTVMTTMQNPASAPGGAS